MTGVDSSADLELSARRALDLVGTDPRAALGAADEVLAAPRRLLSAEARGTAARAAALALKELGDLDAAEAVLRNAVRAIGGQSDTAAAETRMSLAFILLERGRTRAALRQADRAAAALSGAEHARLLGQRALVLQRCGETEQALTAYASALPVLRRAGDSRWEARLLNNRGLLHAYRGSAAQARADLLRARALTLAAGQHLDVADADWNLGFVAAVEGDVPEALTRYAEAEAFYASAGLPLGRLLVDRALVLMRCGLFEDARRDAGRAVEDLAAAGAVADEAEALVALAQVELADGRTDRAQAVAASAAALLRRQDRPAWLLLARWTQLVARSPEAADARVALRAEVLANELHAAGWREEERAVRLWLARRALARGRPQRARALLERARSAAAVGTASLEWWVVAAMLRRAEGNPAGATRAVRAGLAQLDKQRALVGATDLRAGVAARGTDLGELALVLSLDSRQARRVLEVAERTRANALLMPPARPPRDRDLARALTRVRRASAALQASRLSGGRDVAAAAALERAERDVIALTRAARGAASAHRSVTVEELAGRLGSAALAEYVVAGGRLHLLTLVDGRLRLRDLGPVDAVGVEADTLRFALQRLLTVGSPRLHGVLARSAAAVAQLVLDPAPELGGRDLVISPVGPLQALPWHCLPGLEDRAVAVTPSATLWARAPRSAAATEVLLVAGPDLPAAGREVRGIRRAWRRGRVLEGSVASVEATMRELGRADVAHVAAHGHLRADNPMFSSLRLADGALTIYDLERLPRVPRLVVLPACRSAVSSVRSGEELLGLSAGFLGLGSSAVIAAVVPLPDDASEVVMRRVHAHLALGETPSRALAAARVEPAEPAVGLVAASFVCLGAG
ncbi:MAG TPA: CHAT domain-containing protein [Actinomycetes bacterium]|nr:CHAT domain-containing protein [Actinomycetes bacterium]